MNPQTCEHENAVLNALASGIMNPELRDHAAQCQPCAEAAEVFSYMNAVAGESSGGQPLPSAQCIFWRSQLAEKRRLAERAVLAIKAVQRLATVIAVALGAVALAVFSPAIAKDFPIFLRCLLGIVALCVLSGAGVTYLWTFESRPKQSS